MNRRTFLASSAATGGVIAVSGCPGILGDGNGDGDSSDGEDGQIGRRITDEGGGNYVMSRVDFVDQAGTLGQLDHMENDTEADDLVNTYAEADWQRMNDNDLAVAENILEENDSNVEQIISYVEKALNRELNPGVDHWDAPPEQDKPDERAIMYGIGVGMEQESGISNSFDSAHVLKPLAETFADEYLDNDTFETWITGSTEPVTEGEFAHLPVTMAYSDGGDIRRDYIEPAVPGLASLEGHDRAIRSPEESIYSDSEERDYVTGHEYRKALEMAQSGKIGQESGVNPIREISTNLLVNQWSIVDSAMNDHSFESPPPNGLVTHVSKDFGKSVEDAFYALDEQKLGYMENIGRGMQLFYEEHDGRTNLAVGGTLQEPEFYEFPDAMKDTLWNFEYDSLTELEG